MYSMLKLSITLSTHLLYAKNPSKALMAAIYVYRRCMIGSTQGAKCHQGHQCDRVTSLRCVTLYGIGPFVINNLNIFRCNTFSYNITDVLSTNN